MPSAEALPRLGLVALLGLAGCRVAIGGVNALVVPRPEGDQVRVVVRPARGEGTARVAREVDARLAVDRRVVRIPEPSGLEPGCDEARAVGATYVVTPFVDHRVDKRVSCVREEVSLSKNPACAEWRDDTDRVTVTAGVEVLDARTCAPSGLARTATRTIESDDHAAAADEVVTLAVAALDAKPLFPEQTTLDVRKGNEVAMPLGTDDDVAVDDVYRAYRGAEPVGRLIVARVEPHRAWLEPLSNGIHAQPGDAVVPRGRLEWWELAPRFVLIASSSRSSGDASGGGPAGGGGVQIRRSPIRRGLIAGAALDRVESAGGGTATLPGLELGWKLSGGGPASFGVVAGGYALIAQAGDLRAVTWAATAVGQFAYSARWTFVTFEMGWMSTRDLRLARDEKISFGGLLLRLAAGLSF